MEIVGRIEFRPVLKPVSGMLVTYRGEYNNNKKLPYKVTSVRGENDINLQNDLLEIKEIFSVRNTELQEIVCTFDVPTTDINITNNGIYRNYLVEHLMFKELKELTYIMTNELEEVNIWYKNGEIELMGKQHIAGVEKKTGRIVMEDRFREIFSLLGINSEPSNTTNDLRVITEQLRCVGYIPYPVSLSTVDIVPYYVNEKGTVFILMGRKPGQTKFQFIGGFRDPAETNEEAASRELNEEACILIDNNRFKSHKTMFIDDRRYKESVHKVTTALFTVEITQDEMHSAKGCDDIEEIQNFTLESLIENKYNLIRDVHYNIFDKIVNIFS